MADVCVEPLQTEEMGDDGIRHANVTAAGCGAHFGRKTLHNGI